MHTSGLLEWLSFGTRSQKKRCGTYVSELRVQLLQCGDEPVFAYLDEEWALFFQIVERGRKVGGAEPPRGLGALGKLGFLLDARLTMRRTCVVRVPGGRTFHDSCGVTNTGHDGIGGLEG